MPFADVGGAVAELAEVMGERGLIADTGMVFGAAVFREPVVNAVHGGEAAGVEAGACGGADGVGRDRPAHDRALTGDFIHGRCTQARRAQTVCGPRAMVVGEKDKNVGLVAHERGSIFFRSTGVKTRSGMMKTRRASFTMKSRAPGPPLHGKERG